MPTDATQRAVAAAAAHGVHQASAPLLTPYARYMALAGFRLVARSEGHGPESGWERQFYVPEPGNASPADHAWATARFAITGLADHAAHLTLLLPPEAAPAQRSQAALLARQYRRLAQHLEVQGVPALEEVRGFTRQARDELEPFLALAKECAERQRAGELRTLAWPLWLDHVRRAAEHWEDRLGRIGSGDVGVEPREAVRFWGQALDEQARFAAHLLDPAERQAVRQWLRRSEALQAAATVRGDGPGGALAIQLAALVELADDAAQALTGLARDVEAARVPGILTPAVADLWRREAAWAGVELRRAQAGAGA